MRTSAETSRSARVGKAAKQSATVSAVEKIPEKRFILPPCQTASLLSVLLSLAVSFAGNLPHNRFRSTGDPVGRRGEIGSGKKHGVPGGILFEIFVSRRLRCRPRGIGYERREMFCRRMEVL